MARRYLAPLRTLHRQEVFFLGNWITPEQVDALLVALRERGNIPVLLTGDQEIHDPLGGLTHLRELLRPAGQGSIQFEELGVAYQRERIPRDDDFLLWKPVMLFCGAGR